MGAIFVSYRRGDSEGQARALSLELEQYLGADSVFMDVDSIALGRDFRLVLQERLETCDLLLALIGPDWLDIKDSAGNRRLESPTDFVRQEIAAALKRNIPVTPVLVQGAQMPPPERLPDDLKELAFRNGFEISHTRWESDVRELLKRLGLAQAHSTQGARIAAESMTSRSNPVSAGVQDTSAPPVQTGDHPAATWAGVGWKKIVFGALGILVLLVVIAQLAGRTEDSIPSNETASTSDEPQRSAIVTASDAQFVFPVESHDVWKWYLPESVIDGYERRWSVRIDGNDSFQFQLFNRRGKDDRPSQGDLKAMIATTAEYEALRNDKEVPDSELTLTGSVSPDGRSVILSVTGPKLAGVFGSRPADAIFEVVEPGSADQSWTVPLSYQP